jgi:hypothetical protein
LGYRDKLTFPQIISITCDNASPNDTMVTELAKLLRDFPGEANRTRCFAHIVNLIAKSLVSQFDVPKKQADEKLSAAEKELQKLAQVLELDEVQTRLERTKQANDEEADDLEGWVDEVDQLSEEEQEQLSESVRPVRLVLVKVTRIVALTFQCGTLTR